MKRFIVAYVTENEDLYHEIFDTTKEAEAFVGEGGEAENDKAIIFEVSCPEPCVFEIKVEDRT